MLKNFNGDVNRLGNAEKFLLQLIKVSKYVVIITKSLNIYLMKHIIKSFSYKLRIESMLLKEEFGTVLGYLEPNISAIIFAGQGNLIKKKSFNSHCALHLPLPFYRFNVQYVVT